MAHRFDGVVPPHAFLRRALVDFDAITRWNSNTTKLNATATQAEGIALERPPGFCVPNPPISLQLVAGLTAQYGPRLGLKRPGYAVATSGELPHDPALSDWQRLREETKRNGAILLWWDGERSVFELHHRSAVEMWALTTGFVLTKERWLRPQSGEFWLVPTREPGWLERADDVARLLEFLILRVGGPAAKVTLTPELTPTSNFTAPSPFRKELLTPTTPWAEWHAATLSVTFSAQPPRRTRDDLLQDFAFALVRAAREAPRGYVGLAQFRDRLLLPGESNETRAAVLKDALDKGLARVVKHQDPMTNAIVTALELVPSHSLVQSVAATSVKQEEDDVLSARALKRPEQEAIDIGEHDVPAPSASWDEGDSIEDYTEGWKHSD